MLITLYKFNITPKEILNYIDLELPTEEKKEKEANLEQRIAYMSNSLYWHYLQYYKYHSLPDYFDMSLDIEFIDFNEQTAIAQSIINIKNKLNGPSQLDLTEMSKIVPLHILYKYAFINAINKTINWFEYSDDTIIFSPDKFIKKYLYNYCKYRIDIENYITNCTTNCVCKELDDNYVRNI